VTGALPAAGSAVVHAAIIAGIRAGTRFAPLSGYECARPAVGHMSSLADMAVKTFSISMDERTYQQAKAAADEAGLPMSAWMSRSARGKVQRDAAAAVAEIDRSTGHAWAAWTEASERDFRTPEAGKGAA